jgi:hypothetical protein
MVETIKMSGVYALSWRFVNEPHVARHWAYYLTSVEMDAAVARRRDEGTPIVIRSADWLSVDDMMVAG